MLSAEKRSVAAYVISLVAAVINGTNPPENDGINWASIIEFAQRQSVLNIVSYAAEKLEHKPDVKTMT